MAEMHHIRVCALGSERDMLHLLHVMLENAGALDDEPGEGPAKTREELETMVHQLAHWEGGPEDGFLYDLITTRPFGSADAPSTSLIIREEACGLWTACFDFESVDNFQVEDWMALHLRCNRMLMAAQYASHTFGLEKGSVLLCGGRAMDSWDTMGECWMWLIAQYECGFPPEEAVERLRKLQKTLDAEDFGMTIDELLESCVQVLEDTADAVADPAMIREGLHEAVARRDYQRLLSIQVSVAESVLWQTEHNHKWLANLQAVRDAWAEAN